MRSRYFFYRLLLTVSAVLYTAASGAQVLQQIKRAAGDRAKKLTSKETLNKAGGRVTAEMEKARAEFDSTDFDYAMLMSDQAGLFDVRERGELASKVTTWRGFAASFFKDDELTDADRARLNLEMGELAYASGRYAYAETRFAASKGLYEQNGLTEEIGYLKVLANQGLLYATMGRFTQAESSTALALDLRRTYLGDNHSGVASSLNNFGVLRCNLARYSQAEADFNAALAILDGHQHHQSMPYAILLNNQAMLNQMVGRYDDAVAGLQKAIAIAEKLQRRNSRNHLKFLANLALLYQQMGKHAEAESLYLGMEKRLGRSDPDYAGMLNNLALLYISTGRHAEAETSLKKSMEIFRSNFGESNPAFAKASSDLGTLYRVQQKYADAEPLLNNALAIREKTLGTTHPLYVQSQEELAILHWKKSSWEAAYAMYRDVMKKSVDFIHRYFPPMSEAEKTKYWDLLFPRFQRFANFALACQGENKQVLADLFEYQMTTKALLLNTTHRIRQAILSSGDMTLVTDYEQWLDQKERLSRLYAYTQEELNDQRINLDSLEQAANTLERKLSDRSEAFSAGYSAQTETASNVSQALRENEALVEMIRVRAYDQQFTGEVKYVALVLTRAATVPAVAVMDDGLVLETRYAKYYKNAIQQRLEDEISYDQFWAWIDPLVTQRKIIFFCPDGVYNQINLNTLKRPGESYLLQRYDVVQFGNPRDLVKTHATVVGTDKSARLVGFPDYGGETIAALPGTKTEVEGIVKMLKAAAYKTTLLMRAEATEAKIKEADRPTVLHVATHGYFLADVERSGESAFGVRVENAQENPLLRSGLLLAGAGKTASGMLPDLSSNDNGVLTAYEAMNLNLQDTELVILSACETGLGEVKAGEGVYGLQRAFLAAGANAIVMSLWKVDDAATQLLMSTFYTQWLKVRNKQKAFKAAQLSLQAKYKEPYFWGAFVMMGR